MEKYETTFEIVAGPILLMLLFTPILSWSETSGSNVEMVAILLMEVCYLLTYFGLIRPKILERDKYIVKLEKKLNKLK